MLSRRDLGLPLIRKLVIELPKGMDVTVTDLGDSYAVRLHLVPARKSKKRARSAGRRRRVK